MEIFADIVGTHFRGREAKRVCNRLEIDDEVTLVREPHNQYDANAVAVYAPNLDEDGEPLGDDEHIGYIPAANNLQLALALDDEIPVSARVIGFNGSKPTLLIKWDS